MFIVSIFQKFLYPISKITDSYLTESHAARTNDGRAVHTRIMEHERLSGKRISMPKSIWYIFFIKNTCLNCSIIKLL